MAKNRSHKKPTKGAPSKKEPFTRRKLGELLVETGLLAQVGKAPGRDAD
ncbi:MAG: hypothetical protein JRJ82_12815 [Deltaproteobacteria bacterium]|nr:hypothetical protein [Deltaproteobacteria bacterium]